MISTNNVFKKIYKRTKDYMFYPNYRNISQVNFAITYMCNSRCKHCNIWKIYNNNSIIDDELKIDDIIYIFKNSKYLRNIEKLSLTGGEPFLRNDIVDIISFFMDFYKNISLTIPTNAVDINLFIDKLENILKKYSLRSLYISISLDGNSQTHNYIRGIKSNYSNVLKLIDMIEYLKKCYNNNYLKYGISFTITPINYNQIVDIYNFSKTKNIGYGIQMAQNSSSFYRNSSILFEFDDRMLRKINSEIDIIIKECYEYKLPFRNRLFDMVPYYIANIVKFKRYHTMINRCYSGTHSCFMDPYGNIYPCIMIVDKIGNLKENKFDDIWCSKEAIAMRNFINKKKCSCWTPCETIPSLRRDFTVILWNLLNILKGKQLFPHRN